jgi:hypothetical protein
LECGCRPSGHLGKAARVGKYVRQSTAYQVANNTESGRRQYSLVERARRLGWSDVQVIDDDLGRSGGGIVRPGFEKLLAAICERRVGAVLSIEASRLARNGRDPLSFSGGLSCAQRATTRMPNTTIHSNEKHGPRQNHHSSAKFGWGKVGVQIARGRI